MEKKEETARELGLESLTSEMKVAVDEAKKLKSEQEIQFRDLKTYIENTKKADSEREKKIAEEGKNYADLCAAVQNLKEMQQNIRKQLDTPLLTGSRKDMRDADRKSAIEFQRRSFIKRGGKEEDFKADTDNLINPETYRAVVQKLMVFGMRSHADICKNFSDEENAIFKSMGGTDLGVSFFMPEMLGIEVDCNPECGYLLDLYGQVNVTRSTFSYIQIKDYGTLGAYTCDALCDAPASEDGNIVMQIGQTADFRGIFCFNLQVLREANYPILPFMFRAAQRSQRINRNREMMMGDGTNRFTGWAYGAGAFPVYKTSSPQKLNPEDVRTFLNSVPREYGDVTAVMHQNVLALIATMKDTNGRFIFSDGQIDFSPESVQKIIRVSNCLPDPTYKLTKGAAALTSGDFVMAAAHWNTAYYAVTEAPLTITQWPGGSNKWCVKYQFGARDGGFIGCPEAGRILKVQ